MLKQVFLARFEPEITAHVTPSPVNANHNAMLVGTWPCQRLSALRVHLWMHLHATLPLLDTELMTFQMSF